MTSADLLPILVERVDDCEDRPIQRSDLLIACTSREERWQQISRLVPSDRTVLLDDGTGGPHDISNDVTFLPFREKESVTDWVRRVLEVIPDWLDSITVDITALSTPKYFLLCRALVSARRCRELRVGYTAPLSYPEEDLTYGLERIESLPGFFGSFGAAKKTMLIVLLGFEGRRSRAIFRTVGPDYTEVFNGFPAVRPGWENRSLHRNLDFLNDSGTFDRVRFAPASQPAVTLARLLDLYKVYQEQYNIYVAPLGSKPMGLGACLLALMKDDVKIIYHYPSGVSTNYPSGVGHSWLYTVNLQQLLNSPS